MIGLVMRLLGVDKLAASLLTYGLIATVVGGGLLTFGAVKYNAGKTAGISQERSAWQEQRELDIAKRDAAKAATQRQIDAIEAANIALEQKIAAEAMKDLDQARRNNPDKDAIGLKRDVARELNKVGR